jgi:Domain of unknown function (DUF3850)
MKHTLKTWPEFFGPINDGTKTFEIRANDRNFQVGDELRLREFKPCPKCNGTMRVRDYTEMMNCDCKSTANPGGKFTRRSCIRRVTYITDFAQQANFVVMGLSANAADQATASDGRPQA